ncbi:MAG: AMP-binding protein [Pseudonocardiales bacterium]|nr:AMP-binding protein [Pseudonocardiales bacterium]
MPLVERLVGGHLAEKRGDRVCYLDADLGAVTYTGLYEAIRGYAGALRARGVQPGTRGVVVADDSVATVVAVLGLWWHGCTPVPVSHMLTEPEISFIVRDCAARFLHLDAPAAKQLALGARFAALPRLTGDEVRQAFQTGGPAAVGGGRRASEPASFPADAEVLVQYTSGSTGTPKGVRHGLTGIRAALDGFGSVLALTPEDVVLSTAKLSFGYGFGNSLLLPLAAGAGVILLRGGVDVYVLAAALRRHRPSVFFSVPRVYAALLDWTETGCGCDLESVRLCVSAGEHLPQELGERFHTTFGVPLLNGLGATEVVHIVVATRPERTTPGSLGLPVPGVTVTVRDAEGREVPDGAEGRLHVAGPSVMLGYLDRPESTARTLAECGAYTGDIAARAADGSIRYLCRADDLLNLGGFKVSPREIETAARRAHGVADCAVVGSVDANGLEQAIAYAVPSAGVSAEDLRRAITQALREHLAPFKRPARVEVLDALPVTSTGKVARFTLRAAAGRR